MTRQEPRRSWPVEQGRVTSGGKLVVDSSRPKWAYEVPDENARNSQRNRTIPAVAGLQVHGIELVCTGSLRGSLELVSQDEGSYLSVMRPTGTGRPTCRRKNSSCASSITCYQASLMPRRLRWA